VLLVFLELADVHSTVVSLESSLSVHLVVLVLSGVASAVGVGHLTFSMEFPFEESTLILGTVGEGEDTLTSLLALEVLSLVDRPIWEEFFSLPALIVQDPIANIGVSFNLDALTLSMSLAGLPSSLVIVSGRVDHSTSYIELVFQPDTLIIGSVRPNLCTVAFS